MYYLLSPLFVQIPLVFTYSPFLLLGPMQDTTLHLDTMFSYILYAVTFTQTFLVLHAPDNFEYWSGILQYVTDLGIARCYSYNQSRIMECGEEKHSGAIFITSWKWYLSSTWFSTVNVKLSHLAEVIFVRIFTVKLLLFFFLFILYSLEGSHRAHLRLKDWVVMFLLLEGWISI